jgi:hypothetical protein
MRGDVSKKEIRVSCKAEETKNSEDFENPYYAYKPHLHTGDWEKNK